MTKFILKVICVIETLLLTGICGVFLGLLMNTNIIPKRYRSERHYTKRDREHERPYGYGEYSRHYYRNYEDEES